MAKQEQLKTKLNETESKLKDSYELKNKEGVSKLKW